jgi:alpha-L-fucosidase
LKRLTGRKCQRNAQRDEKRRHARKRIEPVPLIRSIAGNVFNDVSGNAVNVGHPQHYIIGGGPLYKNGIEGACTNIKVSDNWIRKVGLEFKQEEAISGFTTVGVEIMHNDIRGVPYGGIALGWGWGDSRIPPSNVPKDNLIAYNRIVETQQELPADGGAIGSKAGVLLVNASALPLVAWLGHGNDRKGFMLTMPIFATGSILLYLLAFRNLEEVVKVESKPLPIRSSFGAIRGNWPWIIIFSSSLCFWIAFISKVSSVIYFFTYAMGRKDLVPLVNSLDVVSLTSIVCSLPGRVCSAAPERTATWRVDVRRRADHPRRSSERDPLLASNDQWSAEEPMNPLGDVQQMMRSFFIRSLAVFGILIGLNRPASAAEPPAPYGPVPTPRQIAWQQDELYAFVHFTVNTFTGAEWGAGAEPESTFNPTDFDADQIARTVADAGMKGLILTAKHHDGFCLWPSKYTEHSVKNSKWKNGKGDVVRDLSQACKRHGIKFGIYLSPWDRNRADYGKPEYLIYYKNQLRELLTGYGPIFELWFDGANGGKGYYGGANEKRVVDPTSYYQWPDAWVSIVRELQPGCTVHSDNGPDNRWCGNERGYVNNPCWATYPRGLPFASKNVGQNSSGVRDGDAWVPAEVDVSIRPGWFYHPREDRQVKTAAELLDIYYSSVGLGADLLLNLPPDKRGQINENDVNVLTQFRRLRDATFATDLAAGAKATASNVRGNDPRFGAGKVIDHDAKTYWATDDAETKPSLILELNKPATFNVVSLREYIPLGQRIASFALDFWKDGKWVQFAAGTSIGNHRLMRVPPVTAAKVQLRIVDSPASVAVSELGLYAEPASAPLEQSRSPTP